MSLTIKEVTEIYRLAAISADKSEIEHMKEHIEALIPILDEMEKVDTTGITPFFELAKSLETVAFKPTLSDSSKDIVKEFTHEDDDYLVVKKVVDKGA